MIFAFSLKIKLLQVLFVSSGFVDWLEKRQLPCFYKSMFGVECPGCGMQRALIALMRGEFVESFKLYPALLPTMFMLFFLAAHLFFHLKNGTKILVALFVFNVIIIVVSYVCKLII